MILALTRTIEQEEAAILVMWDWETHRQTQRMFRVSCVLVTMHPLFFALNVTEKRENQGEEGGTESISPHSGWAIMGHRVPAEPPGSMRSTNWRKSSEWGSERKWEPDLLLLQCVSVNRVLRDIQSAFHSNLGTCSDGSNEGCKHFGIHSAPLTNTHTYTYTHIPSGLVNGQWLNVGCFDLRSLSVATLSSTHWLLCSVVINRPSPRHQEHGGRFGQKT